VLTPLCERKQIKENKIMGTKETCYETEKPEGKKPFRGSRVDGRAIK